MEIFDVIRIIGEAAAVFVVSILYIKSRLPKQTIEQQTQLINALEKRIKAIEDENKDLHNLHVRNEKEISRLNGQLETYKELPLQQIARSLTALESMPGSIKEIISENNGKLVEALKQIRS